MTQLSHVHKYYNNSIQNGKYLAQNELFDAVIQV